MDTMDSIRKALAEAGIIYETISPITLWMPISYLKTPKGGRVFYITEDLEGSICIGIYEKCHTDDEKHISLLETSSENIHSILCTIYRNIYEL